MKSALDPTTRRTDAERSALTKAVATLLDDERDHTNEAIEGVRATVVGEARQAVVEDVRRLADVSAALYDQRRSALLTGIDELAAQVRGFSAPTEMVGATWLQEPDITADGKARARALLPDAWADVPVYD